MTELEQKAEEYKESKRHKCFREDVGTIQINYESYLNNLKYAYIAGATENGIQWHDLRKDPNDLPNDDYRLMFCYSVKGFIFDEAICGYALLTKKEILLNPNVIAWCEIPQFKE